MKNRIHIALAGNPNSGKTSLFNILTGLNQKVGNYPGVTVDKKTGLCELSANTKALVSDLPGAYSLYPRSADEVVCLNTLLQQEDNEKVDVIVAVADASNLKRNLLFCTQLMDLHIPIIIVFSMMDINKKRNIHIDIGQMAKSLQVPIIPINTLTGEGVLDLKKAILQIPKVENTSFYEINFPFSIPPYIEFLQNKSVSSYTFFHIICAYKNLHFLNDEQKSQLDIFVKKENIKPEKFQAEDTLNRYRKIDVLMKKFVTSAKVERKKTFTQWADSFLLHNVWGYIIMITVLFVIFQGVFWFAQFPMDWIDSSFGKIISWCNHHLPQHFLSELFINGILAGLGGIVVFIPQIMILFGCITLLEDSGYMSRISFLSDKLLQKAGMNGKSAVPIISGVACAVPAIMAARSIENKKEKLITILVTPLMSCSARLPVYTILISLVVPNVFVAGIFSLQGMVMFFVYMLGLIAACVVGYIFSKLLPSDISNLFLMELPIYRTPRWKNCMNTMVQKAYVFVKEAGKIILIISVILWLLSSYGPGTKNESIVTKQTLETSYAGIIGKSIEPVIAPLGFDWKIGIALITSFAAREVFVSTMATLYSVENEEDIHTLKLKLQNAERKNGKKVFDLPTGLSLIIFYAFALQCMSTLAIVKRETGSWKYPIIQLVVFTALAYFASWCVYTVFSSLV